jgi:hypothetical protein
MTIKEALIAALQVTGYSEAAIDKALLDAGLNGILTYDPLTDTTLTRAVNMAALVILKGMLTVQSIEEGGYKIAYSVEGIKLRIAQIEGIYGLSEKPTIKRRAFW